MEVYTSMYNTWDDLVGTYHLRDIYNERPRWSKYKGGITDGKTVSMVDGKNGKHWCVGKYCNIYSDAEPDVGWESPLAVPNSKWCHTCSCSGKCNRPSASQITAKCVQGKFFIGGVVVDPLIQAIERSEFEDGPR